jgi:TetR/AcrR family acrAB operon transcriptional repressor
MLEQAASVEHADPIGSLRDLAVFALTRLARDARAQAVFDVMFHKSERTPELATVAERERRERGHCLMQVERLLRQAVAKGQLPPDTDTALATRALHAYMEGVMDQWVLDPSAFDLGNSAPALIDVMLGGLCAAPPRVSRTNRAGPEACAKRPERASTTQTERTVDEA